MPDVFIVCRLRTAGSGHALVSCRCLCNAARHLRNTRTHFVQIDDMEGKLDERDMSIADLQQSIAAVRSLPCTTLTQCGSGRLSMALHQLLHVALLATCAHMYDSGGACDNLCAILCGVHYRIMVLRQSLSYLCVQLQAERTESQSAASEKQAGLESDLANAKKQMDDLKNALEGREQALADAGASQQNVSAELAAAQAAQADLQQAKAQLEETLEQEARTQATLDSELQTARDQIQILGKQLAESEQTCESSAAAHRALQLDKDSVDQAFDVKQAELTQVQQELESRLQELAQARAALDKHHNDAAASSEEQTGRVKQLEQEVQRLAAANAIFEQDTKTLQQQIEELRAQLQTATKQAGAHQLRFIGEG